MKLENIFHEKSKQACHGKLTFKKRCSMRDLKHQLKIDKNFPTLCFATKVNEIFLKIFITEKKFSLYFGVSFM